MNHTVTVEDVKRIYKEAQAARCSPKDARNWARTEVHALIQAQNPMPLPLSPPARPFNLAGITTGPDGYNVHDASLAEREAKARTADLEARKAALFTQLTTEQILESERARSGPDGTHRDAVHYVQKQHGKALWEATDLLVNQALGGTP